jgi:hypothetical protein
VAEQQGCVLGLRGGVEGITKGVKGWGDMEMRMFHGWRGRRAEVVAEEGLQGGEKDGWGLKSDIEDEGEP